jgi:hypothetical protein
LISSSHLKSLVYFLSIIIQLPARTNCTSFLPNYHNYLVSVLLFLFQNSTELFPKFHWLLTQFLLLPHQNLIAYLFKFLLSAFFEFHCFMFSISLCVFSKLHYFSSDPTASFHPLSTIDFIKTDEIFNVLFNINFQFTLTISVNSIVRF